MRVMIIEVKRLKNIIVTLELLMVSTPMHVFNNHAGLKKCD